MYHTLVHIYGPFSIHSFGLMIALGLLLFTWLVQRDSRRRAIISNDALIDVLLLGVLATVAGGRILFLLTNWTSFKDWQDIVSVWYGGLSILGGIIGALLVVPWYLIRHKIPVLPFFDLVALYAPLLHAVSRIGCFLAGCCFGKTTDLAWGVIYTDHESLAPLGVCIHPTQLYSTGAFLAIFISMYYVFQFIFTKPGQLLALYIMLSSLERFTVDFLRGDREFFASPSLQLFSINQWIALVLISLGAIGFIITLATNRTGKQ